jgi:hypothetical protein
MNTSTRFKIKGDVVDTSINEKQVTDTRFPWVMGILVFFIFTLIALALVWVYLVASAYFNSFGVIPGFNPEKQLITDTANSGALWGQFGDFVGGLLNPFMTLLSFLAICITILLQNFQLRQSVKELELSRQELGLSRNALFQGQAIQSATEAALKEQISLARQEKDFASLERLAEFYQLKIRDKAGELSAEDLRALSRRRDTIFHLLDSEFDVLAGRVMDSNLNLSGHSRGEHGTRFVYELLYLTDFNLVRAVILDKSTQQKFALNLPELKEHHETNALVARYYGFKTAHEVLPRIFEEYAATGSWGHYDVWPVGL